MAIDLHQPIDDTSDDFRADITLRCRDVAHFIEVVGCCARDRVVRNAIEKRGLIRTEQREKFYESRGIQPTMIFIDHFARPQELKAQCTALIERDRVRREWTADGKEVVSYGIGHGHDHFRQ